MMASGLRVPNGFVVTTDAFRAAAGRAFEDATAMIAATDPDDHAATAARCEAAQRLLRDGTAGHAVLDRVAEAYAALTPGKGVAVRSSGTDEDGETSSYAGGHDTHLWVRGAPDVTARLRDCWASLFTERAVHYRAKRGRPAGEMAVVVQEMVSARAAGVMMSLNPSNGDRSVLAVEGVWGLGEALVAGQVTPDRFLVDRVTGEIRLREVAPKTLRLVAGDAAGVVAEQVPEDLVHQPSFDDSQLARLRDLVPALEQCANGPADCEFAVDDEIWMLQVRPETYWSQRPQRRPTLRGSALHAVVSTFSPRSTGDH